MSKYYLNQAKFFAVYLIGCLVIYLTVAYLAWDNQPNFFTRFGWLFWTVGVWGIYFENKLWRKNG